MNFLVKHIPSKGSWEDELHFRWWDMGVSKNRGIPKSSILIGFSIINHPFWGTPIFRNIHMLVPWMPDSQRSFFALVRKNRHCFSLAGRFVTFISPCPAKGRGGRGGYERGNKPSFHIYYNQVIQSDLFIPWLEVT